MAEPWHYNARIGWTKVVTLPRSRDFMFMLRCFASAGYWSACVYRGPWPKAVAVVPGSRSRHESKGAARRKLLAWVRRAKKETSDG